MQETWRSCPRAEMNKGQKYALLVAAANVALVFLFPPYDYVSMLLGNVATFDGFYFVLAGEPHRIVNSSFLALETIVVLANACIAVLLLRTPPSPAARRPGETADNAPFSVWWRQT